MRATVAAVLAHALALWLVIVWPLAGRAPWRRASWRFPGSWTFAGSWRPMPHRWSRSMRRKWRTVAVLVPIAVLGDVSLADCGLRRPVAWTTTLAALVAVLAGAVLVAVRVRMPGQRARLLRTVQPFVNLVPRRADRTRFVGLAVTAGVTEELLYRAFGLSYLHWLWPGLSSDAAVAITAVAFGLAHLSQGWKNVVLLSVLGALFGFLTVDAQSVLPAIVVHTLVDLRLLLLTPLVDPADPGARPAVPAA